MFRPMLLLVAALISGAQLACDTASPVSSPGADQGPVPAQAVEAAPRVATPHPPSTVARRIAPPEGFTRLPQREGSFGAYLRALPLKAGDARVYLHDGRLKGNQRAHVAVIDLDVGSADLQQCADAVMRLRAEYLFGGGCQEAIAFNFTSGDRAAWPAYASGQRAVVSGNQVRWEQRGQPDSSYASFRRYLNLVFTYAGSASLQAELAVVADPTQLLPGDVFIQGGFPGHAVIVVDVAVGPEGERAFLLAQSYMPAQDIHVLRSFDEMSPWYRARREGPLLTPEWRFEWGDLRRFKPAKCEP